MTGTRSSFVRWAIALAVVTALVPGCGAHAMATNKQGAVRLQVTPKRVLLDEPIAVRLSSLGSGQTVTLQARFGPWRSQATFQADSSGTVDLSTQAPVKGSYATADTMGLVWSVTGPAWVDDLTDADLVGLFHPSSVVLVARIGKRVAAKATIRRYLLTGAIKQSDVRARGLYGQFFRPAGKTHLPAILVLGGSDGGLAPYTLREAALVAAHGYAALALAYFDEPGLPTGLANIPLEYFGRALAWLEGQPEVDPKRLAVMGTSRGGELALLIASHYPQLKAAISYSGNGEVYAGWPDTHVPAWTWQGKPVPWLKAGQGTDVAALQRAAIPVEQINGPVLLIAGEDDHVWPSTVLSQLAMNRLQSHKHPYADQLLRYPGAGHFIQPPYLPTEATVGSQFGGDPKDQEQANADSWSHILHLLATRFSE